MKKTEKYCLLSSHTKLDYYECYAKIVLEYFFHYYNLSLSDKPDLQDMQNNIGIEVTNAESPETFKAEDSYSKLLNTDDVNEKATYIKKIERCGVTYENGSISRKFADNFDLVNKRIDNKIEKLRKNDYKKFNEYQLFVFSPIYALNYMLQNELNYLIENNIADYYKKIYILVPEHLYYFDLIVENYKVCDVDSTTQCKQAIKARQMVEEGEKDEQT